VTSIGLQQQQLAIEGPSIGRTCCASRGSSGEAASYYLLSTVLATYRVKTLSVVSPTKVSKAIILMLRTGLCVH